MSRNEMSIAVGSAGSATGLGVLRSLAGWNQPPRLLACDTNPPELVAAASEFEFLQVPMAKGDDFASVLGSALRDGDWNAYYPIHDFEIAAAAAASDSFDSQGIQLFAPTSEAIQLTGDKLAIFSRFVEWNVPVPETVPLKDAVWHDRKLHAKPRAGVGSKGAVAIADERDLAKFQAGPESSQMIVQPFVDGIEITIDVFCSDPGEVVAHCCRERVEVKAGVCTKARLFEDNELAYLASRVSKAVGLTGAFCFQVRGSLEPADWQVIDVNPRVGGATPMSAAVGCDFASAHVAFHTGKDFTRFFRPIPKGDLFVTRSYREHVSWPENQ